MYYKISEGNQTELIIQPNVDGNYINQTIKKFPWNKYEEAENRLTDYTANLFDTLSENADDLEDEDEFWKQLTKGQKVFFSFLSFEGEVHNGGLFQFFWNKPSHAYSFLEVIELLDLEKIKGEYSKALDSYKTLAGQIEEIKNKIDTDKEGWEDEYYAGYDEARNLFGSHEAIEKFFYENDFKLEFNKKMCDYIENNQSLFVVK